MDGVGGGGGGVEGEKTSQLRHVQLLNPPSEKGFRFNFFTYQNTKGGITAEPDATHGALPKFLFSLYLSLVSGEKKGGGADGEPAVRLFMHQLDVLIRQSAHPEMRAHTHTHVQT